MLPDKNFSLMLHATMSAVKSKNTKPEIIVRKWLWNRGFRYRLNHRRLPGHPDLVLRKYRTCIFVNGCFWHGHLVEPDVMRSSVCCRIPTTNHEFWTAKIKRNKERDKEVQKQLATMGWHCITVWECELTPQKRENTLESLAFTLNYIFLQDHSLQIPYEQREEENGILMVSEKM